MLEFIDEARKIPLGGGGKRSARLLSKDLGFEIKRPDGNFDVGCWNNLDKTKASSKILLNLIPPIL